MNIHFHVTMFHVPSQLTDSVDCYCCCSAIFRQLKVCKIACKLKNPFFSHTARKTTENYSFSILRLHLFVHSLYQQTTYRIWTGGRDLGNNLVTYSYTFWGPSWTWFILRCLRYWNILEFIYFLHGRKSSWEVKQFHDIVDNKFQLVDKMWGDENY